mmetsp:Transcript_15707/g.28678  ORF Transcript_15707/g.28678 Transcript_15707/m.28678 type:complete len:90 (+) Transcript_15707:1385-1654(+)
MGCCSNSSISVQEELTFPSASEFIDMSLTSIQVPELTSSDNTPQLLESSFIAAPFYKPLAFAGSVEWTRRKGSSLLISEESLETNMSNY